MGAADVVVDNANTTTTTTTTTNNIYYDGKYNDPLLTDYNSSPRHPNKNNNNNNNAQNLCNNQNSKKFQKACPSHRCLLTEDTIRMRLPLDSTGCSGSYCSSHSRYDGRNDRRAPPTEIYRKACCAWDELIVPSGDSSLHNPPPSSPTTQQRFNNVHHYNDTGSLCIHASSGRTSTFTITSGIYYSSH